MDSPKFRAWLTQALADTGMEKRALARGIAAQDPRGASLDSIETARRAVRRILQGKLKPRDPLRASIGKAIGRDDWPTLDDEDDEHDLVATLSALTREHPQLARALVRMVKQR